MKQNFNFLQHVKIRTAPLVQTVRRPVKAVWEETIPTATEAARVSNSASVFSSVCITVTFESFVLGILCTVKSLQCLGKF